MAAASHMQLTAVAFLVVLVAAVSHPAAAAAPAPAPVLPLEVRLRRAFSVALDGGGDDEEGFGILECWGAFTRLLSCSDEIAGFLVDGELETYLGPKCCHAIRNAKRHCWLGFFTAGEAEVLLGHCAGEAAATAPPAAGNAPAPRGKP